MSPWKRSIKQKASPTIPEGQVVYAIGDIHGAFDKLMHLLNDIEKDMKAREDAATIIFLGDLIDRGPDSKKVVELLSKFKPDYAKIVFLMGNHEETFLKVLKGSKSTLQSWFGFGGRACARSYGVENLGRIHMAPEDIVMELQEAVPEDHIDFISSFKDYEIIGDYLFVHAGIKPKIALDKQSSKDMRWIRKKFLDYKKAHPFKIVHGHSVVDSPEDLSNRIAVDTGAHREGFPLTAAVLSNTDVSFIQSKTANE